MKHVFVADIGGTNSRFGHFTVNAQGELSPAAVQWLKTGEAASFPVLLQHLRSAGFPLPPESSDMAVFAVAGPVEDGARSRPPLIPWDIDLTALQKAMGPERCLLINDFVAQAYACSSDAGARAELILPGRSAAGSPVAVIGAGTGLGKALLLETAPGLYQAVSSEGGHTNFPFVTEQESAFQAYLLQERGDRYITGNTVVSGKGLSYLHGFLTGRRLDPADVVEEMAGCPETLSLSARFYGRVCRNYLLETLALGGLFVAGGVAAKAPQLLRHAEFEREFRSSDTLAHLLADVPVSLITDRNSGLWGGAVLARQRLRQV